MKTTTAFKALRSRDQKNNRARYRFMVRSLTKAGVPSKSPLTEADWKFNAFVERSDADQRVTALEGLNPGRKFVVTEI